MAKHLEACLKKNVSATKSDKGENAPVDVFHLVVEGRYEPEYWLHILANAKAKLADLDLFLRDIWLECCGHLSAFTIEGRSYMPQMPDGLGLPDEEDELEDEEEFGEEEEFDEEEMELGEDEDIDEDAVVSMSGIPFQLSQLGGPAEKSMNVELEKVLRPKLKFKHEYDFGSPTELALRVLTIRRAPMKKREPILLLARNDPPEIPCGVCGKPAVLVCSQCVYEQEGWLCEQCAKKHECDEEMFLPVVNSPRTGVCGYTGM